MFEGWDEFYFMTGSSAAGLVGLLFVVATLTSGVDKAQARRGQKLYLTPVVFHFVAVFALSAAALAPTVTVTGYGLIATAVAFAGMAVAIYVTAGIGWTMKPKPHWSDVWYYGAGPGAIYGLLVVASASLWLTGAIWHNGFAAGALGLLLLGIRNAWDLVTYLAPKQ
jgi:hypothetical protein